MESDDAIMALAVCGCGHGIGRHDEDGCPGAQATFCVCTLTPAVALDAAIERIRYSSLPTRVPVCDQALAGMTFDAEKSAADLNFDDYESLGPVRALEPATIVAMLGTRLIRSQ